MSILPELLLPFFAGIALFSLMLYAIAAVILPLLVYDILRSLVT